MYRPVARWLKNELAERFPNKEISVHDTHATYLSDFLPRKKIYDIDGYSSYEIKVDITGIIRNDQIELVFVECKLKKITVKDFSQLLGYSKIATPRYSFLTSPAGFTDAITTLFLTYRRHNILNYSDSKRMILFKWDATRKGPDRLNIIPRGSRLF